MGEIGIVIELAAIDDADGLPRRTHQN